MGEQQVEAAGDRLVDDRLDRVDGQQHAPHDGRRVAADQADRVPVLRERGGVEPLELGQDVGEAGGHGATVRPGFVTTS